jgi:hypothetical protein
MAENRHFKVHWMGDHSVSLLPFVNGYVAHRISAQSIAYQ